MKVRFAVVALTLAMPAHATALPDILAYYAGSSSDASLRANASKITTLATDTYTVDARGKVNGAMPANVHAIAKAHHIALYPVISNWDDANQFNAATAHAILKTGAAQTVAINQLVAMSKRSGVAGINLDFENVRNTDRKLLTGFVQKLADGLHAESRKLIVSVPAATSNDPKDGWMGAFDYARIGAAADTVQVMTYDQNGPTWSAPGPVADLNWVKDTIAYAGAVMPSSKISMGIAAYGYDWNLTKGGGDQIDWTDIPGLVSSNGAEVKWDAASSSSTFSYVDKEGKHVVWFEDPRSIQLKAEYAASQHVGSLSIWSLGQENASFWSALAKSGRPSGQAAEVPEPSSWAMIIAGFGCIGLALRRPRRVRIRFA